jgi:hypothetical protein
LFFSCFSFFLTEYTGRKHPHVHLLSFGVAERAYLSHSLSVFIGVISRLLLSTSSILGTLLSQSSYLFFRFGFLWQQQHTTVASLFLFDSLVRFVFLGRL